MSAPIDAYAECARCGKWHYTHADEDHPFREHRTVEELCHTLDEAGATLKQVVGVLRAIEGKDACAKCKHNHADKTGDLGCWACACRHPTACKCAGCLEGR